MTASEAQPDRGPSEPWLTCVAPFVLYMLAGSALPTRSGGGLADSLGIGFSAYPAIYAVGIAVTLALLARVWPNLSRWLGRPSWWPPLVGLILVVPWVALAMLQRDVGWTFLGGERAGYDPFAQDHLGTDPARAWAFLAVRTLGLAVVVPIVEELFLRGFLLRYVIRERFWEVPFGTLTAASAGACAVYAVASHPAEALAALGWFAVASGIAVATRKPIDCILCHAATNLALGAYVVATGEWWLV